MMPRNADESRFASAFATLVCAWALALVVLGLSGAAHSYAEPQAKPVVTTVASR